MYIRDLNADTSGSYPPSRLLLEEKKKKNLSRALRCQAKVEASYTWWDCSHHEEAGPLETGTGCAVEWALLGG